MEKTIINIAPATAETPRTKRVAAYARVSCGKDTMLHSLAAQIDYYADVVDAIHVIQTSMDITLLLDST